MIRLSWWHVPATRVAAKVNIRMSVRPGDVLQVHVFEHKAPWVWQGPMIWPGILTILD